MRQVADAEHLRRRRDRRHDDEDADRRGQRGGEGTAPVRAHVDDDQQDRGDQQSQRRK